MARACVLLARKTRKMKKSENKFEICFNIGVKERKQEGCA